MVQAWWKQVGPVIKIEWRCPWLCPPVSFHSKLDEWQLRDLPSFHESGGGAFMHLSPPSWHVVAYLIADGKLKWHTVE